MKIFLIWADGGPNIVNFILDLKKRGHEVPYWVGVGTPDRSAIPDVVYHDHYSAWVGSPAEGIDPSHFLPPGKELIERMYKTESVALTMMNKKFNDICVDERRHIYYEMLRYWQGVLDKYKPDAIIFPTVPHTVYNYIIYEIAKLRNIKTIMFAETGLLDFHVYQVVCVEYEDWMEGSKKLRERIRQNNGKNFSIEDLSEDLRGLYLKRINPDEDMTRHFWASRKKEHSGMSYAIKKLKNVYASVKDGSILKKLPHFISKLRSNLKKEYEKLQSAPDLDKKFIYAPLNYQPERTTSPDGDMFADQILMVEMLSAVLPEGFTIYVKEHPSQWWMRSRINYSCIRYKGYYERLARIKNVKLIPVGTHSLSLINKSVAVATVTGSAGWEAIFISKPVLVFGYPWYRDCHGVFMVKDADSCKEALDAIARGYQVDQQKVINYLKSFDESAIRYIPFKEMAVDTDERVQEIFNWLKSINAE